MSPWWTLLVAFAEEPAPVEPAETVQPALEVPEDGRVVLPDPGSLPSALEDDAPIEDASPGGLGAVLGAWRDGRREIWGARTIVRPLLALRAHASGRPALVGLTLGRQWWQLRRGPRATVEALLTGEVALASGAGSWSTEVSVLGGGFVGPLGLTVGPSVVGERTVLGAMDLGSVAAVAPMAQLTLDLGVVQWVGSGAPRFIVAGPRGGAGVGIGDEPVLRSGVGVTMGALRVAADWTGRWTVADRVDRFGVNLRFRF